MKSRLAEEIRGEQLERMSMMSPSERVALAFALGKRAIADYMDNHGVSREEAVRALRRAGQAGRRFSACLDEE